MAIQHSNSLRNGCANLVGDAHDAGSGTAKLQIRDGTDVIVEFPFDNPAFDNAPTTAVGKITLLGVPIAVQADMSGASVDNFRTLDRDGNVLLTGTVTATGMGGDVQVTNTNIAENQDCELQDLTYEAAP